MADHPTFDAFYRATHQGRPPFPWQQRLAARVLEAGWPEQIGVPTGLGKTACIDIAVWALAGQADLAPHQRSMPTRIWYVVNRRLLVDAAFDHAQLLSGWLADPPSLRESWPAASAEDIDAVTAVAQRLASIGALGSEAGPLHVARLRGGADLGARVPDPSQPALVLATVAMFASRWLFRGYGSSSSMQPIDAALAGTDSVVLIDEAHLAASLVNLKRPAEQCDIGDAGLLLPAGRVRPTFVALTATGTPSDDRFDLDADDAAHPVVARRLDARKPITLIESSAKGLERDLAEHATGAITSSLQPTSCVVFLNSPRVARAVWRRLRTDFAKRLPEVEIVLITGQMREQEADIVRRRLLSTEGGVPSGGGILEQPLIVVATQTLEVGADVDFDHLVTETAGVRSLVQRLGRLNRLGEKDASTAVICHPVDAKPSAVYGDEPDLVWQRLNDALDALGDDEVLDGGPGVVASLLGEPDDEPKRAAELLHPHLWEWAKTSVPPPGEAPVEAFFAPLDDEQATVSVVWRALIPVDGALLEPRLRGDEAVELSIAVVRQVLEDRSITARRITRDGGTVETVGADDLRPGNQLILAAADGMYDEYGWDPDSTEPVLDVSPLVSGMLVLDRAVLTNLVDLDSMPRARDLLDLLTRSDPHDEGQGASDADDDALVAELVASLRGMPLHPSLTVDQWRGFLDALAGAVIDRPTGGGPPRLAAPPRRRAVAAVRSDAFDELSMATSTGLLDHLHAVGESAQAIATNIGVPPGIAAVVARAAAFHDHGKIDPRFQRWLDPDNTAHGPLAKSGVKAGRWESARQASGWPRGGRHEVISARLVEAALAAGLDPGEDPDLLVHLVITHHGHGRPYLPIVDDQSPPRCRAEVEGVLVSVSGDLSVGEWDQPARFRRLCERYGYWGLALLEACVRQADHAASAVVGTEGRTGEVKVA